MSQTDTAHAWWSRLRHQGLLLSPVVMVERYPSAPPAAAFYVIGKLRDAQTRFVSSADNNRDGVERDQAAILGFVDTLLENFLGHTEARLAKQHTIPEKLTAVLRSGSRSETVRPHRVIFADDAGTIPAVLVMADTSPQVGRGRGRTKYAQLLELLRGTGHRLGLLTNGQQFRLVYPSTKPNVWYGTEAIDGRHVYLFDRGGAGVIKWDTQTDSGKVIPWPYKLPFPASGRYQPADKAMWCNVWETGYRPLGIARLDLDKNEFTGFHDFPKDDEGLKPYTDPASTLFLPYTLKGKIVPAEIRQTASPLLVRLLR